MQLDADVVFELLEREQGTVWADLRIVEDELFDDGDHGEVMYRLVVEHVGEINSFWRTYYYVHYNDGMESWNPDVFEFVSVRAVVKSVRVWEECE